MTKKSQSTKSLSSPISWLEFQSQQTGKTVEEIRAEMSRRAKLNTKTKFGEISKEEQTKISIKGGQSRWPKKA